MGGAIAAEIYLSYRAPQRLNLPFYNVLYPYVMFRPVESYSYETKETFAMSHFKSRIFVYTNEDGFRIPSPRYKLPKEKPPGQVRIAFLGGSLVQLASTFDTALPGSLRTDPPPTVPRPRYRSDQRRHSILRVAAVHRAAIASRWWTTIPTS